MKHWPRGRGTLIQDAARVTAKFTKEIFQEIKRNRKRRARLKLDPNAVFDALGLPLRRAMLRRLRYGGAMSLSKLCDPYKITLAAGMKHLYILEDSGLVLTHKHGRIRMCIYNPQAAKEFVNQLSTQKSL
jgi:DNA-binding transcriptional ArsR family regulator